MNLFSPLILMGAATTSAVAGESKAPVARSSDWDFSLSAGPAWRHSGSLGFTGGSRSASFALPSFVGNNVLINPPIDGADSYGDRLYNDGFVRKDSSTDIDGLTSYWGYQNASQVSGDDISFHATGFQSIRSDILTVGTAPAFDRNEQGVAPVIQFNAIYQQEIAGMRPGFSASFSWLPVKADREWSDFALSQTRDDFRHDWTDDYNLGGFGNLVPSAPYSGTFGGPGFILENLPDSRTIVAVQTGMENALVSNVVRTQIRADHSTFSFGPTIGHPVTPEWNLEAGIGVSLHWIHWSASQDEELSLARGGARTALRQWSDSSSGDKILGGFYLQISTEWTPKQYPWSLKTLLRADIGQGFSQQLGPSRFTYDTDGFTAAVMVSHPL